MHRKKIYRNGASLVLGVYPIQLCLWAFQQSPKKITATGILTDEGMDLEVAVQLDFGNNKTGKFKSSLLNNLSNTAKIIGTKGEITVN